MPLRKHGNENQVSDTNGTRAGRKMERAPGVSDSNDSGELLVPELAIPAGTHAEVLYCIEVLTTDVITYGKLALEGAADDPKNDT